MPVTLGSECCVASGDRGDEAYTEIAWGLGLRLERSISQGPRVFIRLQTAPEGRVPAPI